MDKILHKAAFIGHRNVFGNGLTERILREIEILVQNGCKSFTMGTHGAFDKLALSACRNLRKTFNEIEIEVVITSFHAVKKDCENEFTPYSDVKTVMYDIENAHFKQRITLSNRKMIDACDVLICYVNEKATKSGAKTALYYAKSINKEIINLYCDEDNPFFGATIEEAKQRYEELYKRTIKH